MVYLKKRIERYFYLYKVLKLKLLLSSNLAVELALAELGDVGIGLLCRAVCFRRT